MRDAGPVRTTLDLDDDILLTAKEMAATRGVTAGQMVSELARKGLAASAASTAKVRNGVPLLTRRRNQVRLTMRRVNELRDDV